MSFAAPAARAGIDKLAPQDQVIPEEAQGFRQGQVHPALPDEGL